MGVTTPATPATEREPAREVVVRYVSHWCDWPDFDDWGRVCPRCGTAVGGWQYCCAACQRLEGEEVER